MKNKVFVIVIMSVLLTTHCACATQTETIAASENMTEAAGEATAVETAQAGTAQAGTAQAGTAQAAAETGSASEKNSEPPTADLPAEEYYLDFPLIAEDNTYFYIKKNPDIKFNIDTNFYPDKEYTAKDHYNEKGIIRCSLTDKYLFEPKIDYVLNPETSAKWYVENKDVKNPMEDDTYYYFETTEIDKYANKVYYVSDIIKQKETVISIEKYIVIDYVVDDNVLQVFIENANLRLTDAQIDMLTEYFGNNEPFAAIKQ